MSRPIQGLPLTVERCTEIRILESGRHYQLHWSAEQRLEFLLQPEVGIQRTDLAIDPELHQEVDVAAIGGEVVAGRRPV